mgnify:FL=1
MIRSTGTTRRGASTKILIFALSIVCLAGCSKVAEPSGKIETIEQARSAWAARGSLQYTFTVELQCFCTAEMRGPFLVNVENGAATVTREGSIVEPGWLSNVPTSADALFAFAASRRGQKDFRATFDQTYGLPVEVWSDPIPEAADDELGIIVSGISVSTQP